MAPYAVYLIRDFHGVLIGRGELVGARQGVGGVGEGGRRDDGGVANSLGAGVDPLTPWGSPSSESVDWRVGGCGCNDLK